MTSHSIEQALANRSTRDILASVGLSANTGDNTVCAHSVAEFVAEMQRQNEERIRTLGQLVDPIKKSLELGIHKFSEAKLAPFNAQVELLLEEAIGTQLEQVERDHTAKSVATETTPEQKSGENVINLADRFKGKARNTQPEQSNIA